MGDRDRWLERESIESMLLACLDGDDDLDSCFIISRLPVLVMDNGKLTTIVLQSSMLTTMPQRLLC